MKADAILLWFYAPSTPKKLSEIIDGCFETNYAMFKPDFDWSKEPHDIPMESFIQYKLNFHMLAKLTAMSNYKLYFGLHDIYLQNLAQQRGTLLLIALRQYKNATGHWPEKLEDMKDSVTPELLIDPINGDSFVYKRTEENFTLYSKGKNGIDDGGKREEIAYPDMNNVPNKGCDDIMIWPLKSKTPKQQEQKANE